MANNYILSYTFLRRINFILLGILIFLVAHFVTMTVNLKSIINNMHDPSTYTTIIGVINIYTVTGAVVFGLSIAILIYSYLKENVRKKCQKNKVNNMIQKLDIISMIKEDRNKYEYKREKV